MPDTLLPRLFPREHPTLLERWRDGAWLLERGPLGRLPELSALAELELPQLLAAHPRLRGDAYGAEASATGHRGRSPSQRPLRSWERLDADAALAHYQRGHTLVFWDVGALFPALGESVRAIARELGGLPPDDPIIAASPKLRGFDRSAFGVALSFTPQSADVGLGVHFDQFDSVAFQLRGDKDWYLASDPRLRFPLGNETTAAAGLPPYMTLLTLEGPDAHDFATVRLTPGTALLNPRGTWHATGGTGGTASLTVLYRFQLPSWLDVISAALHDVLAREPELRQTAFGIFPDRGSASLEDADLQLRFELVSAALARGRALIDRGLLPRLADRRRARFTVRSGDRLTVTDTDVRVAYPDAGGVLSLPVEIAALGRWILASTGRTFALRDVEAVAPAVEIDAWVILRRLVDAGVLDVRWASHDELAEDDAPAPEAPLTRST